MIALGKIPASARISALHFLQIYENCYGTQEKELKRWNLIGRALKVMQQLCLAFWTRMSRQRPPKGSLATARYQRRV